MNCKICKSKTKKIDVGYILNKYNVDYFQCENCGFVQTEDPYWLDESYNEAISISDTGVIYRNLLFSKVSTFILSVLSKRKGVFLDYGGGYGIFTRLMRDYGYDFYSYDKYCDNLVSRGFDGDIKNNRYDCITSFENFEHFENPIDDIEKIFSLTDLVIFSTVLISLPAPKTGEWHYYCLEHGQHVSLFSKKSLEYIGLKYGYYFITNGSNFHIFSKSKISPKIFLIEKIIRKLGLFSLFKLKSKTVSDMNHIIKKQKFEKNSHNWS